MKPSETRILDEIEERLRQNAKKSNGYPIEFKKIKRGMLGGFVSREFPAVNFWPIRHSTDSDEYGNDTHILHIIVDARTLTRDNSFADVAAELIATVFTAVTRLRSAPTIDDLSDFTLEDMVDGVAESVSLFDAGYQIGAGDSPWCGVAVELRITYSSPAGDLFTIHQ